MIAQLRLPRPVFEELRAAQSAHPDRETCGLLLIATRGGIASVQAAAALPNRARNPQRAFRLRRGDVQSQSLRWATARPALGVFHSHPTGSAFPSLLDRASMRRHPGLWLILAPGQARAYSSGPRFIRPIPIQLTP